MIQSNFLLLGSFSHSPRLGNLSLSGGSLLVSSPSSDTEHGSSGSLRLLGSCSPELRSRSRGAKTGGGGSVCRGRGGEGGASCGASSEGVSIRCRGIAAEIKGSS